MASPFFDIPAREHLVSNALAFAVEDRFPVSPGHALIVPRREVATWFEATRDEQLAILELIDLVKERLDARSPKPEGYNVGFNAGEVAGQTVMHLHVHVIPRYRGDVIDPRGGVRHVIPSKGNYLAPAPAGATTDPAFVEKVLTLFDHAQATATYKFAVLLGLIDLCMEHATDRGAAPVSVTTRQLARKVLALYWPQTRTFEDTRVVLRQNGGSGRGARILSLVEDFRRSDVPDPSMPVARAEQANPARFEALVREVEWTLITMPLPRVQVLSRGGEEDRFLYEIAWSLKEPVSSGSFRRYDFDNLIRFREGVAEQLVALATVLRPIVQRRWASKVAQLNRDVVEEAKLEAFLFGVSRESLAAVQKPLIELHDARCFYCDERLVERQVEVDHFIAWARYPDNAIDNLVPAHPRCNQSKSDHLASAAHVARWVKRLREQRAELDLIARRAQWEHETERALAVARVIYLRLRPEVRLWHGRDVFRSANRDELMESLA